jgi:DNA mismatch repair protein MutS
MPGARRDPRYRADHAGRAWRRADPDVRGAGAFGGKLSRAADQGRLPGGDCRAGRNAGRSQGAGQARRAPSSKVLVGRAIVRLVTAGTLTEEALLEPRRANVLVALASCAAPSGSPPAMFRPARWCWRNARPTSSARRWRGSRRAKWWCRRTGQHGPGKRFPPAHDLRQRCRGRAAEGGARGRDARCLWRFTRAMLAAAGGLIAYLDHVGRGAAAAAAAGGCARPAAAWRWTRRRGRASKSSRPAPAGRAGSLIGAVDRCVTGAGSRLLAEDLSAPLLDAPRSRRGWRWCSSGTTARSLRAQLRDACCAPCPISAGRWAGWWRARLPARSRPAARWAERSARALHHWLAGAPDRPALLDARCCCRS